MLVNFGKVWHLVKGYCVRTIFCLSSCNDICLSSDSHSIYSWWVHSLLFHCRSKTSSYQSIFESLIHRTVIWTVIFAFGIFVAERYERVSPVLASPFCSAHVCLAFIALFTCFVRRGKRCIVTVGLARSWTCKYTFKASQLYSFEPR